jgi:hypothetical protein
VLVGLDGEARLEDVLDDPEALTLVDHQHLELVAVAELDERQLVGAAMDGLRDGLDSGHGSTPSVLSVL